MVCSRVLELSALGIPNEPQGRLRGNRRSKGCAYADRPRRQRETRLALRREEWQCLLCTQRGAAFDVEADDHPSLRIIATPRHALLMSPAQHSTGQLDSATTRCPELRRCQVRLPGTDLTPWRPGRLLGSHARVEPGLACAFASLQSTHLRTRRAIADLLGGGGEGGRAGEPSSQAGLPRVEKMPEEREAGVPVD